VFGPSATKISKKGCSNESHGTTAKHPSVVFFWGGKNLFNSTCFEDDQVMEQKFTIRASKKQPHLLNSNLSPVSFASLSFLEHPKSGNTKSCGRVPGLPFLPGRA